MPPPLASIRSPGQWLARSFGWALSCLGGWLLLISLLLVSRHKGDMQFTALAWLLVGISAAAHALLWWKAWGGGLSWRATPSEWLLEVAVWLWFTALTLFQLTSLYLLLVALSLLLGWDTGSNWGSLNTH